MNTRRLRLSTTGPAGPIDNQPVSDPNDVDPGLSAASQVAQHNVTTKLPWPSAARCRDTRRAGSPMTTCRTVTPGRRLPERWSEALTELGGEKGMATRRPRHSPVLDYHWASAIPQLQSFQAGTANVKVAESDHSAHRRRPGDARSTTHLRPID